MQRSPSFCMDARVNGVPAARARRGARPAHDDGEFAHCAAASCAAGLPASLRSRSNSRCMMSLPATTSPLLRMASLPSQSRHEAAGLAHQQRARRDIPRRRDRAPSSNRAGRRRPRRDRGWRRRSGAGRRSAAARRKSRAAPAQDRRGRNAAARRPPRRRRACARAATRMRLSLRIGALAALGDEQFVIGRIIDHAGDDGAVALERDRHREMRDAVQEIGGAVERIDDPAVASVGALVRAAFLAEEAVIRPRLGELGAQNLLGACGRRR